MWEREAAYLVQRLGYVLVDVSVDVLDPPGIGGQEANAVRRRVLALECWPTRGRLSSGNLGRLSWLVGLVGLVGRRMTLWVVGAILDFVNMAGSANLVVVGCHGVAVRVVAVRVRRRSCSGWNCVVSGG